MRILIFEFVTGGGFLDSSGPILATVPPSLLQEGSAMATAIAEDFASIDHVDVELLRDARLDPVSIKGCVEHPITTREERNERFDRLAAQCDWSLIIAPEFDGHLERWTQRVEQLGGRLLGPSSNLVRLTGDKHRLAERLCASDVPTPAGRLLEPGQPLPRDITYPAVVKPRRGAGSLGVQLVRDANCPVERDKESMRIESFAAGTAVSVAVLCGPRGCVALPGCNQELNGDDGFEYRGGSLPLPPPLDRRARALAKQAIATLESPRGYLGLDLIMGDSQTSEQDLVIEINPRLTTSYVGLRRACKSNLSEAMLSIATGTLVEPSFAKENLRFTADGSLLP